MCKQWKGESCICFVAPLFCLCIVLPYSTLTLSYFKHIRIALRIPVPLHEVRLREPSPPPSLHAQPGMPGHPKAPPSPESSGVNPYPSRRHQLTQGDTQRVVFKANSRECPRRILRELMMQPWGKLQRSSTTRTIREHAPERPWVSLVKSPHRPAILISTAIQEVRGSGKELRRKSARGAAGCRAFSAATGRGSSSLPT